MLDNEPNGEPVGSAVNEKTTQERAPESTDTAAQGQSTRKASRPPGPPSAEEEAAAGAQSAPMSPPWERHGPTEADAGEVATSGGRSLSSQPPMVVFQPPAPATPSPAPPETGQAAPEGERTPTERKTDDEPAQQAQQDDAGGAEDHDDAEERSGRRRRRRGGRGRGRERNADKSGATDSSAEPSEAGGTGSEDGGKATAASGGKRHGENGTAGQSGAESDASTAGESTAASEPAAGQDTPGSSQHGGAGTEQSEQDDESGISRRRRRRRRRADTGEADGPGPDDPANTVVKVRDPRPARETSDEEVQSVKGSTRLEAKKQRRREGREQGRRRQPILTESEFLARRESVERSMVVRQDGDRTQIAILEDGMLVEHYVDRANHQSFIGNVYLGKVQNVLPSMEASFVDIGKGRNAVLYAGEVNFDATGLEGQPKRIEQALKSGQSLVVQVTKDPLGHKGARLTSQVSLPGRYLVYVPQGSMTGISRKLPDKERRRLKDILKRVMPEEAGVIVRTAAEGASEEELSRDIARLSARWEDIQRKIKNSAAPSLLYGEPDLTIRVVRDAFNEDFTQLVVAGDDAWGTVEDYVQHVAPQLDDRLHKWTDTTDVFAAYRIDEQLTKALDRKVWLPSGGSLILDRTEAMTVIDVNTGKFTGQGGNLEETVTKNNLEAAEEIVRQLRLRDIGGIIVIDFIDMVLESNRELVLRRLLECLARDRTKHQVAEVTSLGLVQMTRKRVGQGLLEVFSQQCDCCNGRGVIVSSELADSKDSKDSKGSGKDSKGSGKDSKGSGKNSKEVQGPGEPAESTDTKASKDSKSERSGRRRRRSSSAATSTHAGSAGDEGAAASNGAAADGTVSAEPVGTGEGSAPGGAAAVPDGAERGTEAAWS